MDNYIKNEVDLIISKHILMEEKRFSASLKNKREEYYKNYEDNSNDIIKKINLYLPWSRLFEEGVFVLYELSDLLKNQKKSQTPYYLLIHIMKLLNSMKILINNGYIQSSYIIYRTIIENFHLELIASTDIKESEKIKNEFDNPNAYWRKNIYNGKNKEKIKISLDEINFKNIDVIIPKHTYIQELSKFVHGSPNSAFVFEPNITNPDICFCHPFGIINFNVSEYYMELVQYIMINIYANLELIINKKTWFSWTKYFKEGLCNMLLNYNVFSLSVNYYLDQCENKKELWNLSEFFELIELTEDRNKRNTELNKR